MIGGLIPSAVIAASPKDFISLGLYFDPLDCVNAAFVLAAGFFMVWCSLFYGLASDGSRKRIAWIMVAVSVISTMNYMIFKPAAKSGTLSNTIVYDHGLEISKMLAIMGLIVGVAVLISILLTKNRMGYLWRSLVQIAGIVIVIMSILNVIDIIDELQEFEATRDYKKYYYEEADLTLSTKGQNVVVIMLDRAIGAYIPYMMAERPELVDTYDGFTYYSNTLSFAGQTKLASPALFGGYDYTPVKINERSDESLKDKHDEALLTVPVLFSENGYDVTVCDPPFAGYDEPSDLRIYEDYPGIKTYRTEGSMNPYKNEQDTAQFNTRKRNLFCYSMVRCMPLILQKALYNEGNYNAAPSTSENPYETEYRTDGAHKTTGYDSGYMDCYLVLENLDQLTETTDNEKGAYIFLDNNATHNAKILQEPEYEPAAEVDNTEYDEGHADRFTIDGVSIEVSSYDQLRHYESTMAALIQLGKWFDYLRENNLYDNTRIIIVSDHSYPLGSFSDRVLSDVMDAMALNPLLMVKDFNAHGFETSDEFMTNADVPYLSVSGLIKNPTNPFTGNAITTEAKCDLQYILRSSEWNITENQGNQFQSGEWWSIHDDVRDPDNWELVNENSVLP